jgi:Tol biopolymer transport system component
VKLLDFGLAKLLEGSTAPGPDRPTESITAEQKILGTLHYMSPEQLEGREVDPRTDVFAFGVTLYEMVTGRKAFDGTSAASVSAAILTSEPAPLSSSDAGEAILPTGLDHVIRRALAKHPDDRWQTARDVMLELRWLKDGRPRSTTTRSSARRGPRWLSLIAGAAAVAMIAGAFGWWAGLRQAEPVDQPLIRFTIGAPPGTVLSGGSVAVSPDSRKIVFLAGPEFGDRLLWWQSLDSTAAHVVHGTEGSVKPFWSPDSHSIAFYHEQQLKRVRLDGGLPEVIAPRISGTGADVMAFWSPDGTIVFGQSGKSGGLFRVKAAGGEPPVPLAIHGIMPRGLPGDRFLYLVPYNFPDSGLKIRGPGLAAPVAVPVLSNAVYAAGFLVFRQGESLLAQPFDADSVRLTGNPTTIVEDVHYNAASAWTAFDVSSDLLVYKSADPRKLVWRARDGTEGGSVGEIGDMNPAIAPDSSLRLAADRWDIPTNTYHLTTIDGQRSTLMTTGRRERFPTWSPDGEWIVYVFVNAEGSELRRQSSNGTQAGDVLLRHAGTLKPLDYSRDGKYLVYLPGELRSTPDPSGVHSEGDDLWVLPLDGADKQPRRITNTPAIRETTARLSPDVRWIAYTAEENGRFDIWVQEFPSGAAPRRITMSGGRDPSWRVDGTELYYVTNDGTLMALPVQTGEVFTSGTPKVLFKLNPGTIGVPLHLYSATPDGSRFLVGEVVRSPEIITLLVHWTSLLRPPHEPR